MSKVHADTATNRGLTRKSQQKGSGLVFQNLKETWDLESIFPGGSRSAEFDLYLTSIEKDVAALADEVSRGARSDESTAGPSPTTGPSGQAPGVAMWIGRLSKVQDITRRLRQAGAFTSCLSAQDVSDSYARIISGRTRQIQAAFGSVMTSIDRDMLEVPDLEWKRLLSEPALQPIAFNLDERRARAKDMLPPDQEALVNELSVDGYHGWSDLYDMVTGKMTVTIEKDGKPVTLSAGQAANRMSGTDPAERAHVMSRWEDAWAEQAELCALALNRLAGFRLALYARRGWESVLKDPLEYNRMTAKTLDAMWETINANKGRLVAYMERKKKLLGLKELGWHDLGAPIGNAASKMTYDEAAAFIVEQFERFSPAMARLATRAFKERWIESEDRPCKRMGGFCTSFPDSGQSRIFVTFSGTLANVATVAHELGHAFHQSVMNDLPPIAQQYAMNVAETASTLAEMIMADAAVKYARDPDERLMLIDDKLGRAVTLLMNIQSRFLFEVNFYEERRKGQVSVGRLNEIMTDAQKEAFAGALGVYHPHFWASKLHFYNTRVPFYNFPYTFGFLFSAGVYAQASAQGPAFEENYRNLLRDTGRTRVEDLAARHLGVDITAKEFWQSAVDAVLIDFEEFMRITG